MTRARATSAASHIAILFAAVISAAPTARAVDVTTYHYDTLRTGWNPGETVLTPRIVANGMGGQTFKMTSSTVLDDQVDAQPLVVTNQPIQGQGTHDVVYVATENNTLYAIDANSGAILMHRTFGPPVPQGALPGGCGNNAPEVGIDSTPVIDSATGRLYLIAYTYKDSIQRYYLHAVDLSSLADVVTPVKIMAVGQLQDGSRYRFNAAVSRQRSALLLANGNVYAGFASFCDIAADQTRGWVLGWQKDTLAPLAHNELTNVLDTSPDNFFLTSIWMSGYGLASLPSTGDLYFVTGNSDYSGTTLNSVTNIAESAVQISADLSTVKSVFTPDNAVGLEQGDVDYGSGGLLLLPPQAGAPADLAVAAGKDGNMYFLNADNLNNNTTGAHRVFGTYGIGGCWCGQSYFTGPSGVGRVVSSGGSNIGIWGVFGASHPRLTLMASGSEGVANAQDPGFFTAVSTNGLAHNSAVIWAVGRADGSANEYVSLYAYDGTDGTLLVSGVAGTWPFTGGNSNIVPVEANGRVYVAGYKAVSIWGLSSATAATMVRPAAPSRTAAVALPAGVHEIFGTVRALHDAVITVERRDGSMLAINAAAAVENQAYAEPVVGNGVLVRGTYARPGVMNASIVMHAKKNRAVWYQDR